MFARDIIEKFKRVEKGMIWLISKHMYECVSLCLYNFFDWEYQLKIVGEQLEDEGLEFCAFADDGLGMGFLVTDEKFLSKTEYEKLLYLCYKIKENYENNIA